MMHIVHCDVKNPHFLFLSYHFFYFFVNSKKPQNICRFVHRICRNGHTGTVLIRQSAYKGNAAQRAPVGFARYCLNNVVPAGRQKWDMLPQQ